MTGRFRDAVLFTFLVMALAEYVTLGLGRIIHILQRQTGTGNPIGNLDTVQIIVPDHRLQLTDIHIFKRGSVRKTVQYMNQLGSVAVAGDDTEFRILFQILSDTGQLRRRVKVKHTDIHLHTMPVEFPDQGCHLPVCPGQPLSDIISCMTRIGAGIGRQRVFFGHTCMTQYKTDTGQVEGNHIRYKPGFRKEITDAVIGQGIVESDQFNPYGIAESLMLSVEINVMITVHENTS